MSPSQIEELFAVLWFLLATQCRIPLVVIACLTFGSWSLVFSILYAFRDLLP